MAAKGVKGYLHIKSETFLKYVELFTPRNLILCLPISRSLSPIFKPQVPLRITKTKLPSDLVTQKACTTYSSGELQTFNNYPAKSRGMSPDT